MYSFKLIYFLIFTLIFHKTFGQISDKRLCVDLQCKSPVSQGKMLLKYVSPHPGILSFSPNQDVTVYSKSAGSNADMWGVEIMGKRGYVNKKFVRETRMINKPTLLVNTETNLFEDTSKVSINEHQQDVNPNKVKQPFEVVDGTKIYLNSDDGLNIEATERPLDLTTTPPLLFKQKDLVKEERLNLGNSDAQSVADKKDVETKNIEAAEGTNENVEEKKIKDLKIEEISDGVDENFSSSKEKNDNEEIVVEEVDDKKLNKIETDSKIEEKRDTTQGVQENDAKEAEENIEEPSDSTNFFNELGNFLESFASYEKDEKNSENNPENEKISNTVSEGSEETKLDTDNANIIKSEKIAAQNGGAEPVIINSQSSETEKFEIIPDVPEIKNEKIDEITYSFVVENPIKPGKIIDINFDIEDNAKDAEQFVTSTPSSEFEIPKPGYNDFYDFTTENPVKDSLELKTFDDKSKEVLQSINKTDQATQNDIQNQEVENVVVSQNESVRTNNGLQIEEGKNNETVINQNELNATNIEVNGKENIESVGGEHLEVKEVEDQEIKVDEVNLEKIDVYGGDSIDLKGEVKGLDHVEGKEGEYIDLKGGESFEAKGKQIKVVGGNDIYTEVGEGGEAKIGELYEGKGVESVETNEGTNSETRKEDGIEATVGENIEAIVEENIEPTVEENIEPTVEENIEATVEAKENKIEGKEDKIEAKEGKAEPTFFTNVEEKRAPQVTENLKHKIGQNFEAQREYLETQTEVNNDVKMEDMEAKLQDIGNKTDEVKLNESGEALQFKESNKNVNTEATLQAAKNSVFDMLRKAPVQNEKKTEIREAGTDENKAKGVGKEYSLNEDVKDVVSEISQYDSEGVLGKVWGYFSGIFGGEAKDNLSENENNLHVAERDVKNVPEGYCSADSITDELCTRTKHENFITTEQTEKTNWVMDFQGVNSDFFLYLTTTAVSMIVLLFVYLFVEKSQREAPLVAKINSLEKELLLCQKENENLLEQNEPGPPTRPDLASLEIIENLKAELELSIRSSKGMEEQMQYLEKELENSTEVGLELNRMLADMISNQNGSDILISNVELLQKQLVEQQGNLSSMRDTLNRKETENYELVLELEIGKKQISSLQEELDKVLGNIIKIEEEKDAQVGILEKELTELKDKYESLRFAHAQTNENHSSALQSLKQEVERAQRTAGMKTKEYDLLKDAVQKIKQSKNANTIATLLEVTSIKAEFEQLKADYQSRCDKLKQEQDDKTKAENREREVIEELARMRARYEEADRTRLEIETKLQVLNNYFKEKESQLQKEISKYEALWNTKQGEATTTTERIKYMQSELQNYKAQNESLKQEIVAQEVELKSQISLLEKKVHENWVGARQAERRLEDLKQEASQLRTRLTLRERGLHEDKAHNRVQSPLEQNGDHPVSPLHANTSSPPPLLFGTRDHMTTSPSMPPGLPPFLPPPHGGPFMPPPPHLPFMPPPPPNLFPGDHRPPPLGRMSSPPLNSRYSPEMRGYSPYRRSPSPSYDDESESGASPPMRRGYSPFNSRGDYKRGMQSGKSNGKNTKGSVVSSGSAHSNESIEKPNRHNSKV